MSSHNTSFNLKKNLREYYLSYYNGNFIRDFRYLYDGLDSFDGKYRRKVCFDGKIRYNDVINANTLKKGMNPTRKALAFLTNDLKHDKGLGLLGSEIAYYKSFEDYQLGQISNRNCDRLFFDFDIKSDEVERIKKDINDLIVEGENKTHEINSLKNEFRKLILEENLIKPTFEEAKKLCLYFEDSGLKPYLIFSGSKGFHTNLFFDESPLNNFSKISKSLGKFYSKKLGLKYLDYSVFDKHKGQRRLQRCQYVKHSKTNLYTLPIPEVYDYDDVLDIIRKNKRRPIQFDFEEYLAPDGFPSMLRKMDTDISIKVSQRNDKLEAMRKSKLKSNNLNYNGNVKSFNDIDMRELARAYGIDGKSDGEKIIVLCPFHNDHNPSGVIFKERFHCSTCNLTLNYYDFIAKMEGTNDKEVILKKLHELVG